MAQTTPVGFDERVNGTLVVVSVGGIRPHPPRPYRLGVSRHTLRRGEPWGHRVRAELN
jgi:hypothetical protein